MKRIFVFLLLAVGTALLGAEPPNPPIVDYKISVRLDPEKKMLYGTEHLIWHNASNDTVPDLRFHLYLNAFRNSESTFMRESGGHLRGDQFDESSNGWGWTEIKSISLADGTNRASALRYLHPDSPDAEDRTVAQLILPEAVGPNQSIAVDITWEAKLPRVFARAGYADDYFMVGQWFPKIGVWETAGVRHRTTAGWNCHQYHANSEFYADWGNYDVTMTVPSKFVVGSSGALVSTKKEKDKTSYQYVEHNVHDFAWSADPRFKVHHYTFDPKRDVPKEWLAEASKLLGLPDSALQLTPIEVTMLMQPEHEDQAGRYRESLNAVIAFCGLRFGPYPYKTVTLIDPRENAEGSAGMEYPGLFTAGTRTVLQRWPMQKIRFPEIVTIHEYGHEYWYGMVGSNEFEESWLDEGINQYTESKVMEKKYVTAYELPGKFGVSDFASSYFTIISKAPVDPIVRSAWGYASDSSYYRNSYDKPALILHQMEGDLGEATFARCLREFFQRYSFRHPDTNDFFDTFEQVSGRNLSSYRLGVFYGMQKYDLFVANASSAKFRGPRGFFPKNGKLDVVEAKSSELFQTDVTVMKDGQLQTGAEVVFRFTNGTVQRRMFPPDVSWVRYRFVGKAKLASVVIDPELHNLWDSNLLNNSKDLDGERTGVNKLTVRSESVIVRLLQLLWSLA